MIDPTMAYVLLKNGDIAAIRTTLIAAETYVALEKSVYGEVDVKIVPVLMTEITDADDPVS